VCRYSGRSFFRQKPYSDLIVQALIALMKHKLRHEREKKEDDGKLQVRKSSHHIATVSSGRAV
jgi:hypothetical protein